MGLILLPALYVLGFTLIFSLALGEIVKPLFNAALSPSAFWPALLLSLFFLVLGCLHLLRLTISTEDAASPEQARAGSENASP